MNSQLFREELERVVGDSIRESGADGISALLSDVMNIKSGSLTVNPYSYSKRSAPSSSCVVPINDIRGIDSMVYAKGEKLLRCKLAAVYRLIDLHGWTQGIYNHVTARVSQDNEHFLLNPFGMMYNEVTASSLVKVNVQGETVEEGTTNFGVNQAGREVCHPPAHAKHCRYFHHEMWAVASVTGVLSYWRRELPQLQGHRGGPRGEAVHRERSRSK